MRSSWERLRHPVNSRIYLQGSLGLTLVDSLKNPDSSVHRNQVQVTNPLITKTPSFFVQEIPLIIGPTYQLKAVKWPRYGQHVTCCSKNWHFYTYTAANDKICISFLSICGLPFQQKKHKWENDHNCTSYVMQTEKWSCASQV